MGQTKSTINDCPSKGMNFTMNFIKKKYPDINTVSTSELKRKLSNVDNNENESKNNDDLNVLLDIRNEDEYNKFLYLLAHKLYY